MHKVEKGLLEVYLQLSPCNDRFRLDNKEVVKSTDQLGKNTKQKNAATPPTQP